MNGNDKLDFKEINEALLRRSRELLPKWLPGGKIEGREFKCGSLRGESGSSLSVNLETGLWADFASNDKGGDLISLYAAIEGIGQGAAAKRLKDDMGYNVKAPNEVVKDFDRFRYGEVIPELVPPPTGTPPPNTRHPKLGEASHTWCYKSPKGNPMFYISRYDTPQGKEFRPWCWAMNSNRWVNKAWTQPRPLYGLEFLAAEPEKPILIVEGEKAADAARKFATGYIVMTWANGASSSTHVEWSTIYKRKILLWPDSDEAGNKAMREIAAILHNECPEVKIIDTTNLPLNWDAADALSEGFTNKQFITWAKARVSIYEPPRIPELMPPQDQDLPPLESYEPNEFHHVDVSVSNAEVTPPTPEQISIYKELGIKETRSGQPVISSDTVMRVLENYEPLKNLVWFDNFHNKLFTNWRSKRTREWADIDDIKLTLLLQRELGLQKLPDYLVTQAIRAYAEDNTRNEPKDWIETLEWDGENRISDFFTACMGAADNEYTKAASRNWWISMAARVYQPGCKVDTMVILEGAQGKFKSTALGIIGGEWYTECSENVGSKDFFMTMQGKLLIEISELDSFSKAEVTKIKQTITNRVDRYRPPYGRLSKDHPRQCIFVGTTNEDEYLRDHTGARRFWPITVGNIDLGAIKISRDQLFAEAAHRFKANETWWEMPKEAEEEQAMRQATDEWEEVIEGYILGKSEISLFRMAKDALEIDISRLDRMTQLRIGRILRGLGLQKRNVRRDGIQQKMWVKPGALQIEMSNTEN